MGEFYREYSDYLSSRFDGKLQKISINTGTPCPNRDGTLGNGGCVYCNNAAFVPRYAEGACDVATQLQRGIAFFSRKYPQMRYLAYFQAQTATNAASGTFMRQVRQAVVYPGVAGIVIGTRPDCMPDSLLDNLARINSGEMPVIIEYGAESSHDDTLRLINRCHTWQQTVDTVNRTAAAGIDVGLHLIMGLPGENRIMQLQTVDRVNGLPVKILKLHQLQIIRNTALADIYHRQQLGQATEFPPVTLYGADDYAALCVEVVHRLRPDIAIDRFVSSAPESLRIAPSWGLKNHEFTALLKKKLACTNSTPR